MIKKQLTAALLALIMALLCLVGCQPAGDGGQTTTPADQGSDAPSDSEAQTTPPPPSLELVSGGKSDYMILRAESATNYEIDTALYLRSAIEEKCGVRLRIVNELDYDPDKAIVVGNVKFSGADELCAGLGHNDYTIKMSGDHLLVCGGSAESTRLAAEALVEGYVSADKASLAVPENIEVIHCPGQQLEGATLCGKDPLAFKIVLRKGAGKGENRVATTLQKTVSNNIGLWLPIVDDTTAPSDCEIVVGEAAGRASSGLASAVKSAASGQGVIYVEGGRIYLSGSDTDAVSRAAEALAEQYLIRENVSKGEMAPAVGATLTEAGSEYTVMSFNLLGTRGNEVTRFEAGLAQIKQASPDLLGVQECSETWYKFLCNKLGDQYAVVGELNGDSQKWRNAIFYRKDRFELVETKTQWLSATPSSPSMLTGETQYRILTYAILEDKQTGEQLVHCNTHMTIESQARQYQYNVLVKLLSRLEQPMVLTGDFNVSSGSEFYSQVLSVGLENAQTMTAQSDTAPTCGDAVIDFCFVDRDAIGVATYEVYDEAVNGIEPSDHNAIVVTLRLRD